MKFNNLKIVIFLFIIFSTNSNLFCQKGPSIFDRNRISGAKSGSIDTLQRITTENLKKESTGLLEREIDPNLYLIGPGDIFIVSFISSEPKEFVCEVSPEGKLVIPGSGIVDLKGLKLSEAKIKIINQIKSFYKTNFIDVVLKDLRKFKVSVSGSLSKPITLSATAADRVSEVLDKSGVLEFESSERKIRLIRKNSQNTQNVDLIKYYMTGDEKSNPTVLGGDLIIVPPASEREIIQINGDVYSPGTFEFVEGDSLSTLIKFAQGFLKSAQLDSIEYATFGEDDNLIIKHLNLSSWDNILNTSTPYLNDFALKSGDRIFIRKKRDWQETDYVIIQGEVTYPGKYAIKGLEYKLSDLLDRAGGFTDKASPELTEFIRQKESQKIDLEIERLRSVPSSEMSKSEQRYYQAKVTEKKGLMSINFLNALKNRNSDDNIILMNKDSIIVPQKIDYVNIQGRVKNPGNVKYNPKLTYEDYIQLAGGYGFRADESETFITKPKGGQFLAKDFNYTIEPGDVILVPTQSELTFGEIFTTTLTILTQLITVAGVIFTISNLGKN